MSASKFSLLFVLLAIASSSHAATIFVNDHITMTPSPTPRRFWVRTETQPEISSGDFYNVTGFT